MGPLTTKVQIALALLFGVYAYGLIAQTIQAYDTVRKQERERLVAETVRHAATLGDYLGEQRRFVGDLAEGPEIQTFLINRALGMSLQYGLQTSLDAIEAKFRRVMGGRHLGALALYTRFAFLDDRGGRLVDTAPHEPAPTPEEAAGPLRVDAQRGIAVIGRPVLQKGRVVGHLVAWSDAGGLAAFLLPGPQTTPHRRSVVVEGSTVLRLPGADHAPPPAALEQIAALPEGVVVALAGTGADPDVLVVRSAIPGTPLSVATVVSPDALSDSGNPMAFLVIASLVPPLGLGATVYLAVLRRRQSRTDRALRTSRQRLMAISDAVVEGIVMIDAHEIIAFINRPALRILGLAGEPQDHVGQPLARLFHLDLPPGRRAPWLDTIADGQTRLGDDATVHAAGGRSLAVAYGCAALHETEPVEAAIFSFRDIGALKQARAEALQSARLASIGQLAAGIAHEINTPAQYIGDNLSYIEDGLETLRAVAVDGRALADQALGIPALAPAAEALRSRFPRGFERLLADLPQAVRESREGVEQIARIVLSLKEFSHPGPSSVTTVDLHRACETTLTVSRNSWKNVARIERRFDPDLPPLSCQAASLNQVLLNLILNAAQAIEGSGKPLPGVITLTTRVEAEDILLEVSDTGPGVPAAIRERLFDPFFTTKPVGKGTGQGLAICIDIVTRHGGKISVSGAEGEGATFSVRLPQNPPGFL